MTPLAAPSMLAVFVRGVVFFVTLFCEATTMDDSPFCTNNISFPEFTPLTEAYALEHECCLSRPCAFDSGCWAGQVIPLYSAPRTRALSREEAKVVEQDLIGHNVQNGSVQRKRNPAMPEYSRFQIPVPLDDPRFAFVYNGIMEAFRSTFDRTLSITIPVDAFFVDDFVADKWSTDKAYDTHEPGAAYWVHNDCNNFNLCHREMGIPSHRFTGVGIAFVLPLIVPHDRPYTTDPYYHVTSLELYNVSQGSMRNKSTGEVIQPPNRQWASLHGYNVGEIIWFHPFRYHSGHVPRRADFDDSLNPHGNKSEVVGFTA